MEDDQKNGRRPKKIKRKTTKKFKMEDDQKKLKTTQKNQNGRRPKIFKMEDDPNIQNG